VTAGESRPKRCDQCLHWVEGEEWGGVQPNDGINDRDGYRGSCHRHAPVPSRGDWEYEVLNHLSMLSWSTSNENRNDKNWERWEEAFIAYAVWPVTRAGDWCGDFERYPEPRPISG
jgi:hypothetical protein